MERKYLRFDGKDMSIDNHSVEVLFGASNVVGDCYDGKNMKFAFFNTGLLCQVIVSKGTDLMLVEVIDGTKEDKENIVHWLRTYLENGMAEDGIGVELCGCPKCGIFAARFYEKDAE